MLFGSKLFRLEPNYRNLSLPERLSELTLQEFRVVLPRYLIIRQDVVQKPNCTLTCFSKFQLPFLGTFVFQTHNFLPIVPFTITCRQSRYPRQIAILNPHMHVL